MDRADRATIAVIVPTYNRADFLGEALASILAQTVRPDRILVIDDGSTDATRAVATGFGSRIEYHHQPNRGKSSALNAALPKVSESLVWIFDDDDVAEPDALERMVEALAREPACAFAYGGYDTFRSTPNLEPRLYASASIPEVDPRALFPALLERCFLCQGAMLVRRNAYDEVGPFDERLVRSQDYEMLLRLTRRFSGAKVDAVLFHQRHHDGQRGTAAAPITAREIDGAWGAYDAKIFPDLFASLRVDEYNSAHEFENPQKRSIALARRVVVFIRKNLWDKATKAFSDYLKETSAAGKTQLSLDEAVVFKKAFDIYSRGDIRQSPSFQTLLKSARPGRLRAELRAAMMFSLNYRIRRALLSRNREEFLRYMAIFARLCSPLALVLHVWWSVESKSGTWLGTPGAGAGRR